MRMRPKKNREQRLDKVSQLFIPMTEDGMLDVEGFFCEKLPIRLEIGCGKGDFAVGTAAANNGFNLIALEKVSDVILLAMEKAYATDTVRLGFAMQKADYIDEILPQNSIETIYLNFSDPWPKKRNAKRRLTSPAFLERYKKVLIGGGNIKMKTDNTGLFEYSLETLPEAGFEIIHSTSDLHASIYNEKNITTEYERNFTAKGYKINYLEALLK